MDNEKANWRLVNPATGKQHYRHYSSFHEAQNDARNLRGVWVPAKLEDIEADLPVGREDVL